MLCPTCGTENRPAAKFCDNCGGALPCSCTRCVSSNDLLRDYTTPPPAEKRNSSRAAQEGERKQVTVLFADVVGSTALSERTDPEETFDLMRRCVDLML